MNRRSRLLSATAFAIIIASACTPLLAATNANMVPIDAASVVGGQAYQNYKANYKINLQKGDTIVETITVHEALDPQASNQIGVSITGDNAMFIKGERTLTITRVLKKADAPIPVLHDIIQGPQGETAAGQVPNTWIDTSLSPRQ